MDATLACAPRPASFGRSTRWLTEAHHVRVVWACGGPNRVGPTQADALGAPSGSDLAILNQAEILVQLMDQGEPTIGARSACAFFFELAWNVARIALH